MTAELRERLRIEQDARARAAIATVPRLPNSEERGCIACGCPYEDWTLGCHTCSERHRAYDKRMFYPQGEAWYRAQRDAHREYHYQRRRNSGRARYA